MKSQTDSKTQNTKSKDTSKEEFKWYILNTYSGYEKKVAQLVKQRVEASGISNKVAEIFIPTRNVVTVRKGQQKIKEERIYPGYVFIKMIMDDESWYIIRNTEGVSGFVSIDGKPKPIQEDEVLGIKKLTEVEQPEFETAFSIGDAVKIKTEPFNDFVGTVSSVNKDKGKLTVLISIFGRETPVKLDFNQVEKL